MGISMSEVSDPNIEKALQHLERTFCASEVKGCVNGVTHDVNNFLGAMMAYAELIRLDSNLNQESDRMLSQIIDGIAECSNLLSSLTEIARKDKPVARITDLPKLIKEITALRCYELKNARIKIETRYAEKLPSLMTDRPKLKMAISLIITNAIEAIYDSKSRRIKINGRTIEDGVEISIWNSGPIILEENCDSIFQPFYTTKDNGHIGWGLNIARKIAQLHDGDLIYDEKQGFIFRLPLENGISEYAARK